MNESSLKKQLSKLNLGGLQYFESIGSTNDEALAWARQEGLRVRPTCSYVAAYMQRHPETQDLL